MTRSDPAYTFLILGPPGTGKSSTAASIAEMVDRVLLLVIKPGEEKSWRYQHFENIDSELYYDEEWLPDLDQLKATGYKKLLTRLFELRKDEEYGAVIIDPGTDVMRLIEHHILQPHNVGSAGDLKDTRSYYAQLKDKAQNFVALATSLASSGARPKHVLIPWHLQPVKEQEQGDSADQKAQGYEYAGKVLPMMEGAYRRKLQGDVDFVVYTDVEIKKGFGSKPDEVSYIIQTAPTKEKHAKTRAAPALTGGPYDNNMKALFEAIHEAKTS